MDAHKQRSKKMLMFGRRRWRQNPPKPPPRCQNANNLDAHFMSLFRVLCMQDASRLDVQAVILFPFLSTLTEWLNLCIHFILRFCRIPQAHFTQRTLWMANGNENASIRNVSRFLIVCVCILLVAIGRRCSLSSSLDMCIVDEAF